RSSVSATCSTTRPESCKTSRPILRSLRMIDGWARTRFRAAAVVGLFAMAEGASPAIAETGTKICAGVVTDNPPQAGAHLGWAVDFDGTWLVGGAPGAGTVALYNNPKAENLP